MENLGTTVASEVGSATDVPPADDPMSSPPAIPSTSMRGVSFPPSAASVASSTPADESMTSPTKSHVTFSGDNDSDGKHAPQRRLSRKPTPFNQELSDEIRRAGLSSVFPDDEKKPLSLGRKSGSFGAAAAAAIAAASSKRNSTNPDPGSTKPGLGVGAVGGGDDADAAGPFPPTGQ